jgi:hypothetical protein
MTAVAHLSDIADASRLPADGDCFVISANLLTCRDFEPKAAMLEGFEALVLAHGVVTGQGPVAGIRYSHAWLEGEVNGLTMAIDFSNGRQVVIPREIYYQAGNIEPREICRYTEPQARRMLVEHLHYGPWEGAALAVGI